MGLDGTESVSAYVINLYSRAAVICSEHRVPCVVALELLSNYTTFTLSDTAVIIKSLITTFPTCLRISPMLIQYN